MNKEHDSKRRNAPAREKNAGGVFIALGGIVGVLLGGVLGQPSLGLLGGLALGGVIALIIWLRER